MDFDSITAAHRRYMPGRKLDTSMTPLKPASSDSKMKGLLMTTSHHFLCSLWLFRFLDYWFQNHADFWTSLLISWSFSFTATGHLWNVWSSWSNRTYPCPSEIVSFAEILLSLSVVILLLLSVVVLCVCWVQVLTFTVPLTDLLIILNNTLTLIAGFWTKLHRIGPMRINFLGHGAPNDLRFGRARNNKEW